MLIFFVVFLLNLFSGLQAFNYHPLALIPFFLPKIINLTLSLGGKGLNKMRGLNPNIKKENHIYLIFFIY